ncbi:hypothetical protein [Herbaspirillum camelliae]|uniref:hypothetical protein n=1 Tax=Herbaspirillum camelliae TaxID=1892903 RepID=UPI00117B7E65|nr:hypothetical protein [Herbaspirillum camelliae]
MSILEGVDQSDIDQIQRKLVLQAQPFELSLRYALPYQHQWSAVATAKPLLWVLSLIRHQLSDAYLLTA